MGKHERKSNESAHSTFKKISKASRAKLNPLVSILLDKCADISSYFGRELQSFQEVYTLIQEIRKLEKDYVVPLPSRTEWTGFFNWCKEHGASIEGVTVQHIKEGDFGVVAEKDIKENDMYFLVPEKIIMSETVARESKLGAVIKDDRILQHMPNVTLALYLIMELLDEKSFWKPYISVLPTVFNTILYFDIEEMELLKKSTIFDEAIHFCRSIARQYAYFRQMFQNNATARSLGIGEHFTYDLYRWAVSVVMTRQNFLPIPDRDHRTLALVPLWDMCNHAFGKPSSDFNLDKNCLEAYAMKDFKKGEEVFMFYGVRENSSFFLHNGFVCLPNEHDAYSLRLGISKSDLLYAKKSALCEKNGLMLSGSFTIQKQNLIDNKLLLFLKINVLKEDELTVVYENDSLLFDDSEKCKDITRRALSYLRDRASLLLKCCKTTIEEDMTSLSLLNSPRKQLIVQFGISEKQMLQDIFHHCCKEITNL